MSGVLAVPFAMKAAEGEDASAQVFQAEAAVEIDATGRIAKAAPDPRLHPALVDSMLAAVNRLEFTPLTIDGRPVTGSTHIRLRGCAVPAEGGIRVAYDVIGAGPGLGRSIPRYSREAAQASASGRYTVRYRVEPDGRGVVETITPEDGSRAMLPIFKPILLDWIEEGRYAPEMIDGVPVATRMERRVEFHAPTPSGRPHVPDPASLSVCQRVAAGDKADDHDDVALDTRFILKTGS